MATASPQASIEDLVTCPICMERMKEPKHLYCQHAFCAQCLQDWTMQPGNPRGVIVCPICRRSTPIRKGIKKLPTDIGVTRLLDMLEGQQEKVSQYQGFACGVDGASDVVVFCESCGYHLCGGCLDKHHQDQTLWPHLLYIDAICCIQHASRVQNMYCHDCEKVGCSECMQGQHQNHDISDLAEVAKSNRAIMLNLSQSLQDIMDSTPKQPDMISVYALGRKFEELKQQIDSHTGKGHMMLDIWNRALLADLKLKGDKLGKEVSEVEEQLVKGDSLVSFMNRFLQEGSDFQLVTAFSAASQRLHKTTDSLNNVVRRQRNDDYDLAFVGNPIPESYGSLRSPKDTMSCTQKEDCKKDVSTQTQIPTLPAKSFCTTFSQTSTAAKSVSSSSSQTSTAAKSVSSSSSQTSTAAKSVSSSSSQTTHSGKIPPSPAVSDATGKQPGFSGYIAPQRKINQMAFDASVWRDNGTDNSLEFNENASHKAKGIFHWLQGTKEEDLETPVTVFVCNKTGYLYIGEAGWWLNGNLSRITMCTYLKGERTKVMTGVNTTSVAVSQVDGTIAACVGDRIAMHGFGRIPRESQNGSIQHDFTKLNGVREPYGICISDKYWVVLDKKNCVIMIRKLPNDQYVFGTRGSGPGQFCEPSHVCCDSLRDRFIVSDTGNNRVQVFDMSGTYLWEAGQDGGYRQTLKKPLGLCVDGPGNIIVADSGNRRLVVLGWEKGDYLREIHLDIIPHSITVDGFMRATTELAYLVIAGLREKMPVIQTRGFSTLDFPGWFYDFRYL